MKNIIKNFMMALISMVLFGCALSNQPNPKNEEKDITIVQTPRGALLTISERFLFDSGEAVVKKSAYEALDKVSDILLHKTKKNITIEGYTDNIGNKEYNKKLSLARAKAIEKILIEKYVPTNRMTVKGLGEANPKADNSTKNGRRLNRRTEILIVGEKAKNVGLNLFDNILFKLKGLFD